MVNACTAAIWTRVHGAKNVNSLPFPDFKNKLDRPFSPPPSVRTEGFSLFFFPTGGHARAVAIAPRHARESRMQKHCYYLGLACYDVSRRDDLIASNGGDRVSEDWILRRRAYGM